MANPEVIGIDTFAQNLDIVLSNIVHMVQQQQVTATLPLHVNRDWIIRCVQEQIAPDGFTVEPKKPPGPSQGLGPLFRTLPREFRDVIFDDCLVSGYPQFLACSRAMREEGLSQIWEKGVYRMNFGFRVRMNVFSSATVGTGAPACLQPVQQIAERIQHLRIRIKGAVFRSWNVSSGIDFDRIKQFGGLEVRRKSCTVLLEMKSHRDYHFGAGVVQALETLVGFERVDLRVVSPVIPLIYTPIHLKRTYTFFSGWLRSSFGRPSMGWDEEGRYMRFHPRQYVSERSQGLLRREGAPQFGIELLGTRINAALMISVCIGR